jgi:chemotaxis protein MotB
MTASTRPIYRRLTVRRPARTQLRGGWKLAYADFTTAMMAFFLLMWIVNGTEAETRSDIAGYFGGARATVGETLTDTEISSGIRAVMESLGRTGGLSIEHAPGQVRVEFFDTPEHPMFALGEASLTDEAAAVLRAVAPLINDTGLAFEIEGHTDSRPVAAPGASNWSLSARRAEAARQILLSAGVGEAQLSGITGRGASRPIAPASPEAAVNRRISLIFKL